MTIVDKLFAGSEEIHIAKRIGKGGEGEVYSLANKPGYAVKAYLPAIVASREQKIRAMVDARLHSSIASVAFPTQIVVDRKGGFIGFLMRLVDQHREIHELQTPSSRLRHFPKADYRFLVNTAINVAGVFSNVHEAGCVIGDINQRSILVSEEGKVALIDTDSFQVTHGGQRFLCVVGVPEYTPPELQGQSLKAIVRTADHDAFGLAVAIFQILCMDRHPFSGRFKGSGDMPIERAIKEFRFAYSSRDTQMEPPPSTVRLTDLSPKVREYFEAAFSPQSVGRRPTPAQWVESLQELQVSLRPCPSNKAHHYSRHASECPWCRMEMTYGVPMFVNQDYATVHIPRGMVDDKVGFNINVAAIQSLLNSITLPTQISIKLPSAPQASPSGEALGVKIGQRDFKGLGWLALIMAGIVAVATPVPTVVPLVVGGGLAIYFFSGTPFSRFIAKFDGIAKRINQRVTHLQSTVPIEKALETKAQALQKLEEYKSLVNDFTNIDRDYNAVRRQQQLDAHLSAHTIRSARIPKLNSGDLASLASYGFTTAYDAKNRDVQDAHGIGPVKSSEIMRWVRTVEAKFQFRQEYTQTDRQAIQTMRDNIVSRQQGCADSLNKLVENLKSEAKAVTDILNGADPQLVNLAAELGQAEADLHHLKITVPPLRLPAPRTVQPKSRYTASPSYGSSAAQQTAWRGTPVNQPTSGTPSCPSCGSRMVRRMARRGRRSGRSFWGCSRYPVCTGTRN